PGPFLSHRRISMSINLNDDYDGCELQFPESGAVYYRTAPGAAIAFPSCLLHRVTLITRGQRFVMVTHLFGQADEELRQDALRKQGKTPKPEDTQLYASRAFLSAPL